MNAETPTLNTAECGQFLAFWMGVTDTPHMTLVAIIPDGKTTARTFAQGDDHALTWTETMQNNGCNIYFQPNETRADCGTKPSKEKIVAALCRFADIDPVDEEFPYADERDRLARLAAHLIADPACAPTAIIDSGNGIQPLWAVTREPLTAEIITRTEAETRTIEASLGAGGTHNIDRLLRLPGTVNFPNAKKLKAGRGASRARLIHCRPNVCTGQEAGILGAYLGAYVADTGLVRPKPVKPGKERTAAADDDIAALVTELAAAGAEKISRVNHLPQPLQDRLEDVLKARKRLADRWAGLVDDLTESGKGSSRSEADLSLAAMLKAAGFAHTETGLILCAFKHGKANGDVWPNETMRLRQVARAVLRSHEPRVKGNAPPKGGDGLITEGAVSDAFAAAHQSQLRFDHTAGRWFLWDGTRWRREETRIAYRWAHDVAKRLAADTENAKVIITAGKASFAGGVERLAQSDRAFAVIHEIWDRDPWLLGTPGGTVDLTTGRMRPARQEDFITKLVAVAPADGAECPLWLKFLGETTGNDDALIGFLQRWFGYCLTGITREHALLFVHGDGGNGKGVAMNTVFGIMGDYAANAAMDSFVVTRGDKHTTDLAMLAGARMVMTTEVEEGQTWAEARIKTLTGEDPITARFMRQDNFTFMPRFKLTISGNHKPALKTVDNSTRRRFNIVPFTRKPAKPDDKLPEKLIKEWPAILRWMIDGCIEWQQFGLCPPKVVTEATTDYFEAQNYFGRWLDECCILDKGLEVKPAILLHSFQDWCRQNGEEMTDNRRLRGMLEKTSGVHYKKTDGVRAVKGIGLKPPPPKRRDPPDAGDGERAG
jgi:putative DNA primase/helicase